MALGALMRHLVRDVTGINSPIKLRLMTRPAVRRCSGELAADVTFSAGCRNMRTG